MPAPVSVVVPTRQRAAYLAVALRSIAPQVAACGGELVVVEDGDDGGATRAAAEACGARYVANARTPGLNGARNTGVDVTTGALVALVDDDVEVRAGWLDALLAAADAHPDVDAFTGPIIARLETPPTRPYRFCGREGAPITTFDRGPEEQEVEHAWGANLAVRRSAFDRIGGFDEGHPTGAGDEEEWERRLRAAGGRILYVPGAALDHRRDAADARIGALARAARVRGRSARRFDATSGRAPGLGHELRVLAGCVLHGPLRRCANGPILAAHALGRVEEALNPGPDPTADDFLSGRSGHVAGRRGQLLRALDAVLDRAWRRGTPRGAQRRVLVLAIDRPGSHFAAARAELERSRHHVEVAVTGPGERGKFQNLNALLEGRDLAAYDWVLVIDDDVVLPRRFLDRFLARAERHGLRLAQPAHRLASHTGWSVTRRRPASVARETAFVEIGPVTAFHRDTFGTLLPFPDLRMGWGLDVHWAAVAHERGWPIGVVDATPMLHAVPPAATYPRDAAIAEARAFLADRPYLPRDAADRTLRTHR